MKPASFVGRVFTLFLTMAIMPVLSQALEA